ncbi:hypothetical protein GGS21DRAFT_532788 [Xylaria nigripes]|nr:hypothetical protein GGS21DRAFT_532788 [Xylaria nigripes]
MFLGLQHLKEPVRNSKGTFDPHCTYGVGPYVKKPIKTDVLTRKLLNIEFKSIMDEIWRDCKARFLIEEVLSKHDLPPTIDKVICFGLGNDIARLNMIELSQYPAALTIREYLEKRFGHKVRLLTQDPAYDANSMAVLEQHGFEVVGEHGIEGLLMVDENSFVISIQPTACIKQVIADLARPAVFITLSDKKTYMNSAIGDDKPWSVLTTLDPETPRTRNMFEGYYRDRWGADVNGELSLP